MNHLQHTGSLIRAALKGSKIKQLKLANDIRMAPSHLSEILSGKRPVTPALCIGLENHGVGDAEIWLFMYARYELAQERIKQAAL